MKHIGLPDLVGEHILSRVSIMHDTLWRYVNDDNKIRCTAVKFVLDGINYMAVEDMIDNDHTYMGHVMQMGKLSNITRGQPVIAKMRDNGSETLDIINKHTGKVILSIGTDYIGNSYPYFVVEFIPENLDNKIINAKGDK